MKTDEPTQPSRRTALLQLAASGVAGSQMSTAAFAEAPQSSPVVSVLANELKRQGIEVILPTDTGYDAARVVYDHRAYSKKPIAILECASVAHVQEALKVCQQRHLPLTVRGGGHGFAGRATIDGGVIIDLAPMNEVKLDVSQKTVTVGPGVRNGQLLAVTSAQGVAPVTTTVNHVGVIGAAIFLGEGYLSPLYGYMCDNVVSLDMVLANGKLITVSAKKHPDLFWAMRGAGDAFGVVTSMTMRVYDIPSKVYACYLEYDAAKHGKKVMQQFRDYKWKSSEPFLLGGLAPDVKTKEPRLSYSFALIGEAQLAESDLAAIAQFAPTMQREAHQVSWLDLHELLNFPNDYRFYIAHKELDDDQGGLNDTTFDILLDELNRLCADPLSPGPINGTPGAYMFFKRKVGGQCRPAVPPASFDLRVGSDLEVSAAWSDPAMDHRYQSWADSVIDRFQRAGKAGRPAMLANSTVDEGVTRAQFGRRDYARLVELKRKYDPQNVFRYSTSVIRT